MKKKFGYFLVSALSFRLLLDREKKLGNFKSNQIGYDVSIKKEELARKILFSQPGSRLKFLDVGARDGKLTYLLGIKNNLNYDETFYQSNFAQFSKKFEYFGMDLIPTGQSNVLSGDICDPAYLDDKLEKLESFDVVYSNNVFEHLKQPFSAIKNIDRLLKRGGIIITIVPFSQRYHESPGDYFRYTHRGLEALLSSVGTYKTLHSGYDIEGRRNNWQGSGDANDIVPLDSFGVWRETWFAVNISQKL